jgi:fibronectin type 3 domain-containing protein
MEAMTIKDSGGAGVVLSALVLFAFLHACGGGGGPVERGFATSEMTPNCATANEKQVRLMWQDSASNESGFEIERKKGAGGKYRVIASVGANVTRFTDRKVEAGSTYYYRIRAYNAVGHSEYAEEICVEIRESP